MQLSYGEKAVLGFDRHGKVLGAIVPMEAIKIIAGRGDEVHDFIRDQIVDAAAQLLAQAPALGGLESFTQGELKKAPRATIELADIEARRKRRQQARSSPRKRKSS